MGYVSEPNVYIISRPSVDWEQIAAILSDEGVPPIPESIRAGEVNSAAIVEVSARLCYMSFGRGRKDIKDFITNLLAKGDGSVFEHVNYGFVFTGVSRSLTHELVRHRAGFAYSQRSQRFVDEAESPFVIPPALAEDRNGTEEARSILKQALESAASTYEDLVQNRLSGLPQFQMVAITTIRSLARQDIEISQPVDQASATALPVVVQMLVGYRRRAFDQQH